MLERMRVQLGGYAMFRVSVLCHANDASERTLQMHPINSLSAQQYLATPPMLSWILPPIDPIAPSQKSLSASASPSLLVRPSGIGSLAGGPRLDVSHALLALPCQLLSAPMSRFEAHHDLVLFHATQRPNNAHRQLHVMPF